MPPLRRTQLGLTHVTSKVTGHYPRLAEGLSFLGALLLRLYKEKKKEKKGVSAYNLKKIPQAACIKSTSKSDPTGGGIT